MTILIGNFSLSLAMLAALLALVTALAAARMQAVFMLRVSRGLVGLFFVLLTASSGALLAALLQHDFRIAYVAHYTERALPLGYTLAAFWAGQEGSLLLWAWLLAAMSAVAVFALKLNRDEKSLVQNAATVATLAAVCGFFAALMLFAANPFQVSDVIPADGHGLNPMLQDPGMIAHPPMLFLGYAGFTIPFALLVGALVSKPANSDWLGSVRRWSMVSWLFLSIGILLGAQWAYVELGWGGYWAWDPVENASLLPWLTGTALLHSIMVEQHRSMFKRWNAGLIAVTFILCIFGTYITRSGVIDSVHSFGKSLIGTFFLAFLTTLIIFSLAIIVWRWHALKGEHELEGLMGKEGFFLATNVLLVGMTAVTLIGTIFPIISNVMAGQQVTVGPSFYNKVVAPLGLLLAGLMAFGPLLIYGRDAAGRLARGAIMPGIVAISSVVVCLSLKVTNAWALLAAAIATCAITAVLIDLMRSVLLRARSHEENLLTALVQLLDGNHRRYGGQIVHIGMLLIVVGITGSSLFAKKEIFEMTPGQSVSFAGRTLTLASVTPTQGANFEALQATLTLSDAKAELTPQIRSYSKWQEQLNTEVSIQSSWREDVYVTLAASDGKGGVTVQAIINPFVSWIWTGGIILTAGAIIALLPRLIPHAAPVVVEAKRPRRNANRARVPASI